VMIFEMTLDYNVIIPMTITVALSYGVRKILTSESIYTMKLVRRGHYMPEALQVNFQQLSRAMRVMDPNFLLVPDSMAVEECAKLMPPGGESFWFLVKGPRGSIGFATQEVLAMERLHSSSDTLTMGQIANRTYATVDEEMSLFDVIARMRAKGASAALVLADQGGDLFARVRGIILKEKIADSFTEAIDLFSG
jgi:CIC family chloride channel protein